MRSPRNVWLTAMLTLGVAWAPGIASATTAPAASAAAAISNGQIDSAVKAVKQDPNLGGETKVRSLHWVKDNQPPPKNSPSWISGLFGYLSNGAGVLLWVLGAIAVAIAAVWVVRVARTHVPAAAPRPAVAPGQVFAMDIRPVSLPDDIGAAALQLLAEGRIRESLSLLYRGALSRAVHRFGADIGASFTEGEVLGAVQARLDARGIRYFADLVRIWRRAVYAGETVAPESIRPLCEEFRASLDGAAS